MRQFLILVVVFFLLPVHAFAAEYTVPEPEGLGEVYIPEETESFGQGLWKIVTKAIEKLQPAIASAGRMCVGILIAVVILSGAGSITGAREKTTDLVGAAVIAYLLFGSTNTMISLAVTTVNDLSSYGKLLLPVMTSTMAAQGDAITSGALYTATAVFDAVLSGVISGLLVPMVYIYLVLAVGGSALGDGMLEKLRDQIKGFIVWVLKTALYIFMGYMSITRVISGSADAAALKATKLTISGMVPVVGGILSDASEAILVSAGMVKNTVGAYGLWAVLAIWIEPFLRIGVQYLLLKGTLTICEIFGPKRAAGLIKCFSAAMGLLLAMTGAVCVMLLVSVVCFMKGVS